LQAHTSRRSNQRLAKELQSCRHTRANLLHLSFDLDNITQSKKFSEMLADAIKRYQNNALTAAEIIEELIRLAKDIKQADQRGEKLNLDFRELAFYDALEVNDSAVHVLGDDIFKTIARELVESVKNSVTIDWDKKESVQAKMRVMIKRILKKYGYPPDKQEKAVIDILKQAKQMADDFSDNQ
jgi:type I restriction enzyme R subunit